MCYYRCIALLVKRSRELLSISILSSEGPSELQTIVSTAPLSIQYLGGYVNIGNYTFACLALKLS